MKITQYEVMLRESTSYEWGGKNRRRFDNSETVYNFITAESMFALGSRPEEHLVTFALDCKGQMIGFIESSVGELSATSMSTRQILMFALQCNAAAILIAHNHPSGDTMPSAEDIMATEQLKEACSIMQVKLIDHIIVSRHEYTSLRAEGIV